MSNDTVVSKGGIEDIITKKIIRFYVKIMDVGPREARTYILHDMIIIRLKGRLLPIEERLLEGKEGIKLVKDIRKTLHELTTKRLRKMMQRITKHKVISSHSDVSTKTGERIEIFILDVDYETELCNQFGRKTVEKNHAFISA